MAGTTVSNGGAVGLVVATGMRTEIGKIQANVQEVTAWAQPWPRDPPPSPLIREWLLLALA